MAWLSNRLAPRYPIQVYARFPLCKNANRHAINQDNEVNRGLYAPLNVRDVSRKLHKSVQTAKPLLHLLSLLGAIAPVILALDLVLDLLRLLGLLLPLLGAHLSLAPEEFLIWHAVAAAKTVPEGGELAVVVVEIEVVHCVAGSAVDDGAVSHVLAVVDHNGPDLDEAEENNVGELLQREQEWEQMVWNGLRVAIKWVEGVRGEWGWHDPLVVRLVEVFVDERVVKTTVDPVDAEIGEGDEEGELQERVPAT